MKNYLIKDEELSDKYYHVMSDQFRYEAMSRKVNYTVLYHDIIGVIATNTSILLCCHPFLLFSLHIVSCPNR